jgi:hypothetical protein
MKLSKLFGILLVLISISFNSCLIAKDVRKGNKEENYSKEDLELRRKIAQMLILGFRGTELKSSDNIYKLRRAGYVIPHFYNPKIKADDHII